MGSKSLDVLPLSLELERPSLARPSLRPYARLGLHVGHSCLSL